MRISGKRYFQTKRSLLQKANHWLSFEQRELLPGVQLGRGNPMPTPFTEMEQRSGMNICLNLDVLMHI